MQRVDDALLIAQTGQKIYPGEFNFKFLIDNLKTIKGQMTSRTNSQDDIARLEKAVDANPSNIMQQFELAQKYVQAGKNESAYKVLDRILAFSDATIPQVMSVADAYNRLGQKEKLVGALAKLTELVPDSPEAWYDLAAAQAELGKATPVIEALKKSLNLNAKRLAKDSKATDVRTTLSNDERFSKLRDTAEFKAIVGK
jgi:predicted Zn-dependent protease